MLAEHGPLGHEPSPCVAGGRYHSTDVAVEAHGVSQLARGHAGSEEWGWAVCLHNLWLLSLGWADPCLQTTGTHSTVAGSGTVTVPTRPFLPSSQHRLID